MAKSVMFLSFAIYKTSTNDHLTVSHDRFLIWSATAEVEVGLDTETTARANVTKESLC